MTDTRWIGEYRGRPWRADAEGPDAYDCRGLVRAVQQRVWGREVPALLHPGQLDWPQVREACERAGWHPVPAAAPQEGDILVMRGLQGAHVGVLVRVDRWLMVLHCTSSGGVRLNTPAEIGAAYRRPQVWRYAA